jgi:hypothetical protein
MFENVKKMTGTTIIAQQTHSKVLDVEENQEFQLKLLDEDVDLLKNPKQTIQTSRMMILLQRFSKSPFATMMDLSKLISFTLTNVHPFNWPFARKSGTWLFVMMKEIFI